MNKQKNKVLIITDRYAPYYQGGAEKSLEILILSLHNHFDFTILSINSPTSHEINLDNNKVIHRNYIKSFDFNNLFRSDKGNIKVFTSQSLRYFKSLFRISKFIDSVAVILNRFFAKQRDYLDIDINILSDSSLLKNISFLNQFDLIHCDNYLSFTLFEPITSIPSLFVIRDNRLYCSNRFTLGYTNNESCKVCELQCLNDRGFIDSTLSGIVMKSNQNFKLTKLKKFDAIITTSNFMQNMIKSKYDINSIVIGNQINIRNLSPNLLKFDHSNDVFKVVCIGRISFNKGTDLVLKLFNERKIQEKNIELIVVGQITGTLDLSKFRNSPNIKIIAKHKPISEVYKILAHSHLCILPARTPETFGRVAMESILSGTPVLLSDSGNYPELVRYNDRFLFNPYDINNSVNKVLNIYFNFDASKTEIEKLRLELLKSQTKRHISYLKVYKKLIAKNEKTSS